MRAGDLDVDEFADRRGLREEDAAIDIRCVGARPGEKWNGWSPPGGVTRNDMSVAGRAAMSLRIQAGSLPSAEMSFPTPTWWTWRPERGGSLRD